MRFTTFLLITLSFNLGFSDFKILPKQTEDFKEVKKVDSKEQYKKELRKAIKEALAKRNQKLKNLRNEQNVSHETHVQKDKFIFLFSINSPLIYDGIRRIEIFKKMYPDVDTDIHLVTSILEYLDIQTLGEKDGEACIKKYGNTLNFLGHSEKLNIEHPMLYDFNIVDKYNVTKFPTTLYIPAGNTVTYKYKNVPKLYLKNFEDDHDPNHEGLIEIENSLPQKEVDVTKLKQQNDQFIKNFNLAMNEGMSRFINIAQKNLEDNKKIAKENILKFQENQSFTSKLPIYQGIPKIKKLKHPLAEIITASKHILFFDATDTSNHYKAIRFVRSSKDPVMAFCLKWNSKDDIDQFRQSTGGKAIIQAVTDDSFLDDLDFISEYPCLITILDDRESIKVQTGL